MTLSKYKKQLIQLIIVYGLIFVGLHLVVRMIRMQMYLDVDHWWPVSIFLPKMPQWEDVVVLVGIGLGFWLWWRLMQMKARVIWLVLVGGILILQTNLLQGFDEGWVIPIAGKGISADQYWQDASKVNDRVALLRFYEWLQPDLKTHSRTHPPGPILLIYGLRSIWNEPVVVMLVVLLLGLGSAFLMNRVGKEYWQADWDRWSVVLFLSIPAVQVYAVSTIDMVICSLFLASYWFWVKCMKKWQYGLVAGVFVWLSMWFTFASFLLLPLLFFVEWRMRKNVVRSLLLLLGLGLLWLGVYGVFGYNYGNSFMIARELEGTLGLFGSKSFGSYLVTRLEDVLELVLFLGPVLLFFVYQGLYTVWKAKDWRLPVMDAVAMVLLLGGMFVVGSYATGETARSALFVYPFLLMLAMQGFKELQFDRLSMNWIWGLVFGQAVLMQLFGWYGW